MKVTVFFKDIKKEIISNLLSAKKEIKVAVAWLTDEDIIRTLNQKKAAGIEVEIVISNSEENFKNTRKFKDFFRNQGKLFIATKSFLHNKFCIIDGQIIINGSYNWSYAAMNNEENIMILVLDRTNKVDEDLFKKFDAKHKYFCEKLSNSISDMATLNNYRVDAKDTSKILSQLDEREILLRDEFEKDVNDSANKADKAGIPPSLFFFARMKADGGGVEFVKRILHDEINSGDMKSGFKKLEETIPHRVELSLEYLVSRPKYESLFSKEEVEFCAKLMKKYNL